MKNNIFSNELCVDVKRIRRAAGVIKDETETFRNDLRLFEQCLEELMVYWKGEAADSFRRSVYINIAELKNICCVFEKLSGNYDFAANEYAKNGQKAIDIVNAI